MNDYKYAQFSRFRATMIEVIIFDLLIEKIS